MKPCVESTAIIVRSDGGLNEHGKYFWKHEFVWKAFFRLAADDLQFTLSAEPAGYFACPFC